MEAGMPHKVHGSTMKGVYGNEEQQGDFGREVLFSDAY